MGSAKVPGMIEDAVDKAMRGDLDFLGRRLLAEDLQQNVFLQESKPPSTTGSTTALKPSRVQAVVMQRIVNDMTQKVLQDVSDAMPPAKEAPAQPSQNVLLMK